MSSLPRVAVIDYGLCNIDSITRALELNGAVPARVRSPEQMDGTDLMVLPGVGSFDKAVAALKASGLDRTIRDRAASGVPLLGICLGMQLLSAWGEEGGGTDGLGLLDARVVRLKTEDAAERIPHIGWNAVAIARPDPLMDGIEDCTDFYFVHSYHMQCNNADDVVARTPYCAGFNSIVRHANVIGTQFHPEKSWPHGHKLLANFIKGV